MLIATAHGHSALGLRSSVLELQSPCPSVPLALFALPVQWPSEAGHRDCRAASPSSTVTPVPGAACPTPVRATSVAGKGARALLDLPIAKKPSSWQQMDLGADVLEGGTG